MYLLAVNLTGRFLNLGSGSLGVRAADMGVMLHIFSIGLRFILTALSRAVVAGVLILMLSRKLGYELTHRVQRSRRPVPQIISTVRCSIPPPTRRSNPIHPSIPSIPTQSTYRFGCFKPFYGNLNQLRKTTQDHLRPSETI